MPVQHQSLLDRPATRGPYGFGCKVWIAYQLEKHYLGGIYYVWFAKDLNPLHNGDSSNPLIIYADFDRAVKKRDINHPKLKDFKARLLDVVARLIKHKDPYRARALRREILAAPIEAYRPQLWRLDLSKIAASRVRTDQSASGWDEQYVADLAESEFEIIVE